MSNTGFGLRLVDELSGRAPRIREYYVPSTDGTALYQGDVVGLVNAMDPNNEVPVVTRAATGNVLLGVVIGFRPDASLLYTGQFRAASTNRYVMVCDDRNAVYAVQEDAVGGSLAAATIGEMQNANIIVASGSTVTGLSGTMLDSSTNTASAADCKIVGVQRDVSNPGNVASTGGAVILVKILASATDATDSRS